MGASVCKVNKLRLLSLAMALVMLISCFPVLAFCEEDSWETEAEYDDSSYWDSTEDDEEEYIEEYDPWEETEKRKRRITGTTVPTAIFFRTIRWKNTAPWWRGAKNWAISP